MPDINAAIKRFGSQTEADLNLARAIATAALEKYADFDEPTFARFKENGIWNDDAAVQASLATIHVVREQIAELIEEASKEPKKWTWGRLKSAVLSGVAKP